jgi:hypothetical protein
VNHEQELKRAVHNMLVDLLDNGGGTPEEAAKILCDIDSDLEAKFGRDYIERVATLMSQAELSVLSRAYTALFRQFNEQYFASRLPQYSVRVFYDVDSVDGTGCVWSSMKVIRLRVTGDERWMIANLLKLMAAVSANFNEAQRRNEMGRLRELGAPVETEVRPGTWNRPGEAQCAKALALLGRIILTCDPLAQHTLIM